MRCKALVWVLLLFAAWGKAWAETPVYVVDLRAATPQEKLTTVSLQGLLNRDPQGAAVFTLTNAQDEAWLAWDLRLQLRPTETITPDQLLEKFRSLIKGQVLYTPDDPLSLNLATSLAGLKEGIVTDRDLGLPTIADLRGKFKTTLEAYLWAEKELFPQVSRQEMALLGNGTEVRDYIIAHHLLALPLPASNDREAWNFLGKKLSFLPPGAIIFSPAPERTPPLLANWANYFGYDLAGGEAAANLSFHAKFPGPAFRPRRQYGELQARIYVCFLFSGGDDLAAALGKTRQVWQDPARPDLPLGWAMPPALAKVAPDVLQAYAADAYRSKSDNFVLQIDQLSSVGEKAINTLGQDQAALETEALLVTGAASGEKLLPNLRQLADRLHPAGIFLLNDTAVPSQLIGDTAVVSKGFAASRPEEISSRLDALPGTKAGLIFFYLNNKTITPGDLAGIVSRLPDYFEVVGPEEFLLIARQVLANRERETAADTKFSLQAPENIAPDASLVARGVLSKPAAGPVLLLYRQGDGPKYFQEMSRQGDGSYQTTLPPLLRGGDWILQARAGEADNKVAWSQEITVKVEVQDEDKDDLDRPEEILFGTDPNNPDSDGDGLLDGYDPDPLQVDASQELYFGPLAAGEDAPYIVASGNIPKAGTRTIGSGENLLYRLPTTGLPPGAPVVLGLRLQGQAEVTFSADGQQFGEALLPRPGKLWSTVAVPTALTAKRELYFRLTPAKDNTAGVSLQALALFSPAEAPSLARATLVPAYPGPGSPFGISADIWDPQGIKEAWGCYRAGKGVIKVALQRAGNSPTWQGALGEVGASGPLEWWLLAENTKGGLAASRLHYQWGGTFAAETLSLSPGKELEGFWQWQAAGWGAARSAAAAGERDQGEFSASGGSYTVWALTGGNRELAVWLDGNFFQRNAIKAAGWQNLGEIKLKAGNHTLEVVSGPGEEGALACYGQILLTTAKAFSPPPYGLLATANSITLFSPSAQEVIGPRTEVKATATGNISRTDFYVDGKLLKRLPGPPYEFIWDSGQLPEGRHVLQMTGLGRAGQILSTLAIEVEFSRKQSK